MHVVKASPAAARLGIDGSVITDQAFAIRFFSEDSADRLLIVNLGARVGPDPIADPLMAPPNGMRWKTLWSSDDPRYGGPGGLELDSRGWTLPAEAAVLLTPISIDEQAASR